jgi:hypothetical protein
VNPTAECKIFMGQMFRARCKIFVGREVVRLCMTFVMCFVWTSTLAVCVMPDMALVPVYDLNLRMLKSGGDISFKKNRTHEGLLCYFQLWGYFLKTLKFIIYHKKASALLRRHRPK